MESLETILSTYFILLSLGISAIVYVINLVTTYIFTKFNKVANENAFYKNVFLPTAPILIGAGIGYFTEPGILTGLVAGLLSGFIFRIVKSILKSKISKN